MQLAEDRVSTGKSTGLCTECALRHHDYKEMLPQEMDDGYSSETPLPQAWIDGKRCALVSRPWAHQNTCSECDREAPGFYLPMKQ